MNALSKPGTMTKPADFDDYARGFSEAVQRALREVHSAIRQSAPAATETMSYDMPAFALNGKTLVWFAAFKAHIGFYPGAKTIAAFAKELSSYKTAKGSVQFPLDAPMPVALIRRMVEWRVHASTGSA